MGNDEFILFIRKNGFHTDQNNSALGRKIWEWLRDRGAKKQTPDVRICLWNDENANDEGYGIPKTATQFKFDSQLLPDLYSFLTTLQNQ